MKICKKCGIQKPLSSYTKHKKTKDKLHTYCKICMNIMINKWAKENKAYKKSINDKSYYNRKYGISIEDKLKLIELQNNRCAICNTEFKDRSLACIDHCHDTNKLREILCNRCNLGLGYFKDSQEYLKSALKYLKKHQKKL